MGATGPLLRAPAPSDGTLRALDALRHHNAVWRIPPQKERQMTREEMRAVAHRHVTAENGRDIAAGVRTYHNDCFYESTPLGLRFVGKDAVSMQYAALFGAMPDAELTVDGEAFGDNVLVHWGTFRGTLRGPFLGVPPTGRSFALPFAAVLYFKQGQMEGERLFFDLATLCEQGGLSVATVQGAGTRMCRSVGGGVLGLESG